MDKWECAIALIFSTIACNGNVIPGSCFTLPVPINVPEIKGSFPRSTKCGWEGKCDSRWDNCRILPKYVSVRFDILNLHLPVTRDSDTFRFWHFPVLKKNHTLKFWHLQVSENSDTIWFWHFQILTRSDSDTFRFWHFQDWNKNWFWHFQILTISCVSTFFRGATLEGAREAHQHLG